ncbi:rhodanese-like domain-containing protein [Sedimenticola sp.]|uniref:rhodanese-like domain-containing protein n=1 Tax=Sedimenticola sp. TaxID=1940285 RepID=UPI003D143EFB
MAFVAVCVALVAAQGQQAFGANDEVKVGAEGGVIPLYLGKPYLHVMHEGRSVKVQRVQDPDFELRGYFAKTIRQCPPFCIRPMDVDPAVETIGEIEIFHFMEDQLRDGLGMIIDARTPEWHAKGTIPGSVNIPFTVLSKDAEDPEMAKVLISFGAKPREPVGEFTQKLEQWGVLDAKQMTDKWDFSNCKELVLWCNGPACGQSPRAIQGLLAVGYPPEKIKYYRGGMQMWQLFGLTTVN